MDYPYDFLQTIFAIVSPLILSNRFIKTELYVPTIRPR